MTRRMHGTRPVAVQFGLVGDGGREHHIGPWTPACGAPGNFTGVSDDSLVVPPSLESQGQPSAAHKTCHRKAGACRLERQAADALADRTSHGGHAAESHQQATQQVVGHVLGAAEGFDVELLAQQRRYNAAKQDTHGHHDAETDRVVSVRPECQQV